MPYMYSPSLTMLPCSLTTTTTLPSSPCGRRPKQPPSAHFSRLGHRFAVSCDAGGGIERRNVLLGGMYGAAANLVYSPGAAISAPITFPPSLDKCSTGTDLNTNHDLGFICCPPKPPSTAEPPLYKILSESWKPPKVRRAAQHIASHDPKYIDKFEAAISAMKALPDDDPRSFQQQANVHCAYCNLAYDQSNDGQSDIKLQIHKCWHFFPWHRWYLYFYERILGKLIGDPGFALPYWNYDNPDGGMVIPSFYTNEFSPLYDANRDPSHSSWPGDAIVDLRFAGTPSYELPLITTFIHNVNTKTNTMTIENNCIEMYREMMTNSNTLNGFYGEKYVVGTPPDPGEGAVERGSHTAVHSWVGSRTQEGYDMGNFSTAARDPIFFGLHANIDRLWTVWRDMREQSEKPWLFTDSEWLDAEYLFYNEEAELVRVRVADCFDHVNMGYTYEIPYDPTVEHHHHPWVQKPVPLTRTSRVNPSTQKQPADITFPVKLDKVIKVMVDRPRKSRSKDEKEEEEELLEIQGIQVDSGIFVRFEVYVNMDENDKHEELIGKAEYAGSFSELPQKRDPGSLTKSTIRFGLTELLEDLKADDDDKILVALVPKAGGEAITIDGIKIIYDS